MKTNPERFNTTLSSRQFKALCNDVANEAPDLWEQNPQMDKRTVLLKHLLSKVKTKLGFFPTGVTHEQKTLQEAVTVVCNVLTNFRKIAIDYDCGGTIQEELFDKVLNPRKNNSRWAFWSGFGDHKANALAIA